MNGTTTEIIFNVMCVLYVTTDSCVTNLNFDEWDRRQNVSWRGILVGTLTY